MYDLEAIRLLKAIEYNTRPLRVKYPETMVAIFLSSTADSTIKTAQQYFNFIPDSPSGYLTELQRTGQASVIPGTTSKSAVNNNPYSIELRPVTDLTDIFNAQDSYLSKLEYYAFNTIVPNGTGQNGDVVDDIYNSRANNNMYAQSYFNNGMMPVVWQPNYFRPQFYINNNTLIRGISQTNYSDKLNQGDYSIGLPLPYCYSLDQPVGKVDSMKATAQLAQFVGGVGDPPVDYFQRYPIMCVATFYFGYNKYSQ